MLKGETAQGSQTGLPRNTLTCIGFRTIHFEASIDNAKNPLKHAHAGLQRGPYRPTANLEFAADGESQALYRTRSRFEFAFRLLTSMGRH
jgi:hypothetical protein